MPTTGQTRAFNAAHRKRVVPNLEPLETRLALSGSQGAMISSLGTITGRILNDANGRGVPQVVVELLDTDGQVAATTHTGPRGRYAFHVKASADAPYVIHAVVPKRFTQTSPTFADTDPAGSYAINPATGKPYGGTSWNYRTGNNDPANGPVGPGAWESIAPAGALPFESPINLTGPTVDLSRYLTVHYGAATPKAVINNGAQIQVQLTPSVKDSIVLNGEESQLIQFHYHDAAEHQVDGRSYPMEEHFVNVSASGAETVVAVFLQLGPHNAAFQPLLDAASAHLTIPNSTTTIDTPVDFAGLLPASLQGWFYEGSLTTPPLSQPVNWLVLSTPITLDAQQLQQYEAVANASGFLPNNRPIQPTDGRQLNQFNIHIDYQGEPIQGANFHFAPRHLAGLSASSRPGKRAGRLSTTGSSNV